eukprot:TRINITY_DN36656_c0_g1_i2.p1 TRINITY_DN36656_c0_g1~~TRINITY_DN36656_c0_g1_i2.p1  ORF type:complete len:342 (+),score=36.56 TRINITY_DN36656_c0_g1_i2:35-1060(+)
MATFADLYKPVKDFFGKVYVSENRVDLAKKADSAKFSTFLEAGKNKTSGEVAVENSTEFSSLKTKYKFSTNANGRAIAKLTITPTSFKGVEVAGQADIATDGSGENLEFTADYKNSPLTLTAAVKKAKAKTTIDGSGSFAVSAIKVRFRGEYRWAELPPPPPSAHSHSSSSRHKKPHKHHNRRTKRDTPGGEGTISFTYRIKRGLSVGGSATYNAVSSSIEKTAYGASYSSDGSNFAFVVEDQKKMKAGVTAETRAADRPVLVGAEVVNNLTDGAAVDSFTVGIQTKLNDQLVKAKLNQKGAFFVALQTTLSKGLKATYGVQTNLCSRDTLAAAVKVEYDG